MPAAGPTSSSYSYSSVPSAATVPLGGTRVAVRPPAARPVLDHTVGQNGVVANAAAPLRKRLLLMSSSFRPAAATRGGLAHHLNSAKME